jgi:hypothetical protein
VLFAPADPRSPANRRISVTVMNRESEDRALRGGLAPGPEAQPAGAPAAQANSGPSFLAPPVQPARIGLP